MTVRFLMSMEQEFLSILEGSIDESSRISALNELIREIAEIVPAMPGAGLFCYLGRFYVDTGCRLEAALAEYDSPYHLALGAEQAQDLVALAAQRLRARGGPRLTFVANNLSGVLAPGNGRTSGCHENSLVLQHPRTFGRRILPYKATRWVYAGAGNFYGDGTYVACTRATFLTGDEGGGTTDRRALHSLARDEHHVGTSTGPFRHHDVSGDTLRSQRWGTALRAGAMVLAIAAVEHDPRLVDRLPPTPSDGWHGFARECNVLRRGPHGPLAVDPRATAIQRVYLEGARRYVDTLGDRRPDWAPRLLDDWETLLAACADGDLDWLSIRVDPFVKHRLFESHLESRHANWSDLARRGLLAELTLLGQRYHEFSNPEVDLFRKLEEAGVIEHRVGERIPPGGEPNPFVLEHVRTRARPRSRLLRDPGGDPGGMCMNWSIVRDGHRHSLLNDPFADEFGPWTRDSPVVDRPVPLASQ